MHNIISAVNPRCECPPLPLYISHCQAQQHSREHQVLVSGCEHRVSHALTEGSAAAGFAAERRARRPLGECLGMRNAGRLGYCVKLLMTLCFTLTLTPLGALNVSCVSSCTSAATTTQAAAQRAHGQARHMHRLNSERQAQQPASLRMQRIRYPECGHVHCTLSLHCGMSPCTLVCCGRICPMRQTT
jgi:hypothetical protein